MPDLQAALQSVLNQWEEPKEQTVQTQQAPTTDRKPFRFGITNNVTRVTFEYVQNNPAQTPREICAVMEQRGYKKTSVSSLLGQMVLAGLLRRDADGKYWAAKREYEPYSAAKLKKARKPVVQARAMKQYVPTTETKPTPAPPPEVKVVNSVEELIDTLTIAQARDLFGRLKKLFA